MVIIFSLVGILRQMVGVVAGVIVEEVVDSYQNVKAKPIELRVPPPKPNLQALNPAP